MINLMFCGNDKMMDGLIIALLSIAKNTNEALSVYILTMEYTEMDENYKAINKKQAELLEKIIKEKNSESCVHLIDITSLFKREMAKSKNIKTHYTPYILVRLFSDKIKEIPDKILYLDCDIVVYKDIAELYNIDIEKYDFAASLDALGRKYIDKNYINSGVLLFNMKKMRKEDAFKKCRDMVVSKKMMLPDQTALNKVCNDKLYLPDKFNEQKKRHPDTVIRHFSMTVKVITSPTKRQRELIKKYSTLVKFVPDIKLLNVKPWNVDGIHELYNIHDYDDVLDEYNSIKEEIENVR